ncbi:MAG: hypothetical protein BMS9Abin36_1699 [Gammaproteobacteria bacterium]|nr:MAG: hypothetical protein BMS9Abin36_1699 [Gammaproteobacteria bacterium]
MMRVSSATTSEIGDSAVFLVLVIAYDFLFHGIYGYLALCSLLL